MKYIYGSIAFILVFLSVLLLTAPYSNIAESALQKAAGSSLHYQSIEAGLTGASLSKVSYSGNSIGDISLSYSPFSIFSKKIGIKVHSEKFSISTPMGEVEFQNIDAKGLLKGNRLIISNLTSDDAMKLNLAGTVEVDTANPQKSVLDIAGTLNFLGSEKNITLKGPADRVQPSIR